MDKIKLFLENLWLWLIRSPYRKRYITHHATSIKEIIDWEKEENGNKTTDN